MSPFFNETIYNYKVNSITIIENFDEFAKNLT